MNHSVPVPRSRCGWPSFLPMGWLGLILLGTPQAPAAEPAADADGLAFFETKIRPVLVERCYKCHSATSEKLKGGLQLDSRAGLLHGGDTRAAIVPGDPEKSLMMEAIRYGNPDLQMPPKQRLSVAEVADFATWIKAGAPWPSAIPQRPVRYGGPSARCHRHGTARRSPPGPHARLQGGTKTRVHEDRLWRHQGLVHRELLTMKNKIWLARGSPHWRWRGLSPPS